MKETQIYRVCEQRAQSLLPNRLTGGSLGLFGTQSSYLGRFKWQLPASRKNLTVSNLGKDMDLSLLCTQYSARDELHHTALLLCHQDAPPRLEFLLTNRACSACKGWHPKSRLWLMAGPCCQSSLSKSPAVRWPQVYTHAHAVFTEVKQAACMLYLPKKIHIWVAWTQRRNSETTSCCCCWKKESLDASCSDTSYGKEPWHFPAEPARRYVLEATSAQWFLVTLTAIYISL